MFKLTKVGTRLGLISIRPPLSLRETDDMVTAVKLHSGAARKSLYCTDLRATTAFAPDVIDRIIDMMTRDNPFLVRNAIVHSPGSSMGLQMLRALKASQSGDKRRAFDDPALALEWLSEVLTGEEQTQVGQFLLRTSE